MYNSVPDYNLFHNNTFAMRVKASEWIQFDSPDDLPVIFQKLDGRRWKVIGAGSNLLFTGDYDGVLLHSSIKGITIGQSDSDGTIKVRIGSGETFDDVISFLASKGLWGAENLSGIPGQIGAGVIQNVGAYGVEMKDILDSIEAYDTLTNQMVAIDVNECKYAYRDSRFKHSPDRGRYIVTSATIRVSERPTPKLTYGSLDKLVPHDNPTPVEVREAVIATRRTKLPDVATAPSDFSTSTDTSAPWPTAAGSAGSYFKNPLVPVETFQRISAAFPQANIPHYPADNSLVKIPAAWLIEQSGFKGIRKGNVGVWYKQPLILVNLTGHAEPCEIIALEKEIISAVESRFGITLSPEVEKV